MLHRQRLVFISVVLIFSLSLPIFTQAQDCIPTDITRISVANDGTQANAPSDSAAISADGRYLVFESFASNLVPGDTNGRRDIFVHDRQIGTTTRVSIASDGTQGNDESYNSAISADGRYVAFASWARNLVTGDTNAWVDIFVHDRQTGATTRVSVVSDGTHADGASYDPALSGDGRFVAFESLATNLVTGDTNSQQDIFVYDRDTGTTTRVSVATDGTQAIDASYDPALSSDGRFVAFASYASSLTTGDNNGARDVFVHDQQTGQTTRVSIASDGVEGNNSSENPAISADGRYIAFHSVASNLVDGDTNGQQDIFVYDWQTGQTTRISVASDGTQADGASYDPVLSGDGHFVAFESLATNLLSGDTNDEYDIFIRDQDTGTTIPVSVASDGTQADGASYDPALSGDGHFVAFESLATNLVPGNSYSEMDFFVRSTVCTSTEPGYGSSPAPDSALDMGFVLVGQPVSSSALSISETGAAPLVVSNLVLSNPAEFALVSPTFPLTINDGGAAQSVSIRCTPSAVGTRTSTLTFTTNDVTQPTVSYDLKCAGVLLSPANATPERNAFQDGDTVTLTWNPVSWATKYHIQVDTDTAFQFPFTVNNDLLTADTLSLPVSDLGRTTYYWRVRAQKPDGSWGGWSAVETFVIW